MEGINPADLQSAPFDHFGTLPESSEQDLNLQPTAYKAVALPLSYPSIFLLLIKYSAGFEPANYGFVDHSLTNWVTVQHFFPWIRTTINGSKIRCPTIGRGRI